MICVETDSSGFVFVVTPQPADVSTCTAVLVVPGEMANNPFAITAEQGTEIGGAIFLLWAVAWAFATVAKALNTSHVEKED